MKIQLDMTTLADQQQPMNDPFFSQENQYREPTAGADGVSFPSEPTLKRFVIATSIIALGTASLGSQHIDMDRFRGLTLDLSSLPSAAQTTTAKAAERYAQLKQDIVASGVPLLEDEETPRGNS